MNSGLSFPFLFYHHCRALKLIHLHSIIQFLYIEFRGSIRITMSFTKSQRHYDFVEATKCGFCQNQGSIS